MWESRREDVAPNMLIYNEPPLKRKKREQKGNLQERKKKKLTQTQNDITNCQRFNLFSPITLIKFIKITGHGLMI